jgi:F-type H+-transporting ATPase subunit a
MAAEAFIILDHTPLYSALEKIEGIDPAPIIHAGLVSLFLVGLAVTVNRSYRKNQRVLPEEKTFTVTNFMEMAIGGLLNFMEQTMGDYAKRFLPLIGTTGIFILISNLLGTIPGFDPPTSNLNTTLACAIVIVVATHYVGIRTHGAKYIKHFLGPVLWLAPLMFVIEVIGHLARILSLSFRLFGNMFGDHMVLGIFMGLVPLLIPVAFMGLGVFVSVVQAFVFTLLSILYISGALEEAH